MLYNIPQNVAFRKFRAILSLIRPDGLSMSCKDDVGTAVECALPFSTSRGAHSFGVCDNTRHTLSHKRRAPHLQEEAAMAAAMSLAILQGNG